MPACGTIEREKIENRGEPAVEVTFKQESGGALLVVALFPERAVVKSLIGFNKVC